MFRSLFLATLVLLGGVPASGQSVISNVKSWQEPGTHRIKISYDVAAGTTCTTALQASRNGGANYDLVIPPDAIMAESQIGPGMSGSGRIIQIDASKVPELRNIFTKDLRFKVVASQVNTVGAMVFIPGGTFQMGDPFSEGDSDERPVHSVTVSAFYLQNTEVTKAQWDAVREWGAASGRGYTDLRVGGGKAANHPVHTVSWWDVVKWCNARSEMEGLTAVYRNPDGTVFKNGTTTPTPNWSASGYRLPTEAEWERAARGGLSSKRFPGGDTIAHSLANYYSSTSYAYDVSPTRGYHPTYNDGVTPYTSPVGSFPATGEWQLYDMAGNVWEWCWDWYSSGYYSSSPGTDPRGPSSGSHRVVRGGGWSNFALYCRTAFRGNITPDDSYVNVGFRPARSSVP